ncbi:hypothetical protein Tco_0186162 [Tanacetum coccineum]
MSSSSSSSYRCYNQDKCGVYGFLDLELPSDYYKGLVYSLHEENKALKRMNRMPVGVMDGTSGVVSNNSFGGKHLKSEFTFIKSKFKIYDRIFGWEVKLLKEYGDNGLLSSVLPSVPSEILVPFSLTSLLINMDKGKGKVPVPPFGSPERPRPDVTPRIAESFKSRPCHPELIRMYGYQSTDEY